MYKRTHINNQRRANALTIKNLQSGEVILSAMQRRDTLVDIRNKLMEKLLSYPKKHIRRAEIADELREIDKSITALNITKQYQDGFPSLFMQVAKKHLTISQYKQFVTEAEALEKAIAEKLSNE